MTLDLLALLAIDTVLHPIGVVRWALALNGERHLSARAISVVGCGSILPALVLFGTVSALEEAAFKMHSDLAT